MTERLPGTVASRRLELAALEGIGDVAPGDDVAELIVGSLHRAGIALTDDDVLVVTQKVVSKAEGRVVDLSTVVPSDFAVRFAERWARDPRQVELVLRESAEVVRMAAGGLIISRTRHGFVCANAGVDLSNVPDGHATLLPLDPDASARRIRDRLAELTGARPGIVISDSFGRAWRNGIVNVAIGSAGIEVLLDLRGEPDANGRPMRATVIAIGDELSSAADLVGGKADRRPVVLVRGYAYRRAETGAGTLVMDRASDLFP